MTGLVAVGAGYGGVSACKSEPRVAMFGNRVSGTVPICDAVTIFAAILVEGHAELIVVRIFVAIGTGGELHFVDRVFAGRCMAFLALDFGVFALQRIARRVVFSNAEQRWLPAFHSVTLGTLALPGTSVELALVRIGRVAVFTFCERQWFLEIALDMTRCARNSSVLALKRIFSLGVVEIKSR